MDAGFRLGRPFDLGQRAFEIEAEEFRVFPDDGRRDDEKHVIVCLARDLVTEIPALSEEISESF
jgi:hypothetical protein